jgi:hypothetical protein
MNIRCFILVAALTCAPAYAERYQCKDHEDFLSLAPGAATAVYFFKDYIFLPKYYVIRLSINPDGSKSVGFLGFAERGSEASASPSSKGASDFGLYKDFKGSEDAAFSREGMLSGKAART